MRRYLFLLSLPALLLVVLPAARSDDKDKGVPEGFEPLFNGKDLTGWVVNKGGNMDRWGAAEAEGVIFTKGGGGGWLMTEKEYGDFELRLQYKVPEKGNSGVGLRSPLEGDPAYVGMEIQILDDPSYKGLRPAQHTGSIYDVVAAEGWDKAQKPQGEWNQYRIVAKGRKVMVELNGTKLVDADLDDYKSRADKHPGLLREKGHIGLQSHDGRVEFRNLYLKPL
jgi:hypothetical protein